MGACIAAAVAARDLTEDEVAVIEELRDEKYPLSWQEIADMHFKELRLTGAELRRRYKKAMDALEAAAHNKVSYHGLLLKNMCQCESVASNSAGGGGGGA